MITDKKSGEKHLIYVLKLTQKNLVRSSLWS